MKKTQQIWDHSTTIIDEQMAYATKRMSKRESIKSTISRLNYEDLDGPHKNSLFYQDNQHTDDDCTNDPHPALETPLVYFLLRPFPRLLRASLSYYDLRWDMANPLQNRIPFSRFLRRFKIFLTWSEVLLVLPFFVLVVLSAFYASLKPSVAYSGQMTRIPLIFTFITATKNNILTLLFGLPVERAMRYHKIAARLAYFNAWLHTLVAFEFPVHPSSKKFLNFAFQDQVETSGSMMVIVMTILLITSIPYIRTRLFELFYFLHILCASSLVVCAFFHTGKVVPILAFLTWGIDFFIRKIYMPLFRYPRKASLRIISSSVIELSFPKRKGFDFNPGQYLYIAVPKISCLQWHPFSISSSPKQKVVTLHIRKIGWWTNTLYSLAERSDEIDVLIEGPFGSLGVDFSNPFRYQSIMLFSGGIGVTPMQSLCNSLLYEHRRGKRNLENLSFVWIERDPVVMSEVAVVRRESIRCADSAELGKPIDSRAIEMSPEPDGTIRYASQLLALIPESRISDIQLTESFREQFDECNYDNSDTTDLTCLELQTQFNEHNFSQVKSIKMSGNLGSDKLARSASGESDSRRSSINLSAYISEQTDPAWRPGDERTIDQSFLNHTYPLKTDAKESPLDLQVFVTERKLSKGTQSLLSEFPFVHFGRPNIKELLLNARNLALSNGRHVRIAVCVCAPRCMVELCRNACVKYSDQNVTFDFHYEVFG